MSLRTDAETIYQSAIRASLPDRAVQDALTGWQPPARRTIVLAVGKAAWRMAQAAQQALGKQISAGLVVTKYGHSEGPLDGIEIIEADHPVPDENSVRAAQRALLLTQNLTAQDTVLLLISGGGSALFELPRIELDELQHITQRLLASGADITEINTVRKRLSAVKGGQLAAHCAPAHVEALLLSDVLGDKPDTIASGLSAVDATAGDSALPIAERYGLPLSTQAHACLAQPLPQALPHVHNRVIGGVSMLCHHAADACAALGYRVEILTESLCCTARDAGIFLANIAQHYAGRGEKRAFLTGGETVVRLTGQGKGGRNQELALAAAEGLRGLAGAAVFSVGSDGTDGPTDTAGGYVDGSTYDTLRAQGISIPQVLADNDAYHVLRACGGLIVTGATGTNVNDLSALLIEN
ncbi:glycerate kinase [uncultured Agathobaculum sp.]|uniref:glycerate kinase type-2 family protein n=1 Tax=uncultured Agathobaculum sp. TaxID=2048140 RepID=UPI00320A1AA2